MLLSCRSSINDNNCVPDFNFYPGLNETGRKLVENNTDMNFNRIIRNRPNCGNNKMTKTNKFDKKIKGKQNVIVADNKEITFSNEPQKVRVENNTRRVSKTI